MPPVTGLKEAGVAIPVPTPLNSPGSGGSWRMAWTSMNLIAWWVQWQLLSQTDEFTWIKQHSPWQLVHSYYQASSQGPGRANSILSQCFLRAVSVPLLAVITYFTETLLILTFSKASLVHSMLIRFDEQNVTCAYNAWGRQKWTRGWEINPARIQGPIVSVHFLGIRTSGECQEIPSN